MKKLITIIILTINFSCISQNHTKEGYEVFIEKDSVIWIPQSMNSEYRVFGFQNKSVDSKKLILLSGFTKDVEKNPFNCRYGAFYHTQSMNDLELKYLLTDNEFMKIAILKKGKVIDNVYMETKWFKFEE